MNIYNTHKCGDILVKEWKNDYAVVVIFLNTGYETTTNKWTLEKKTLLDPYAPTMNGKGYIGEGDYQITVEGKRTPMYIAWANMMATKEVCTEWLNYQNFAEWYLTHYEPGLRMMCSGGVCSPSTASLVTRSECVKKKIYKGCYYKESIGKWRAYYGGDYDTPEEAEAAFMQEVKPRM